MVCKWLKGKRVSRSRNALQLREGQDTLLLRLQNCPKRKELCNSGYANTRRTKTVEVGLRIKKKRKKKVALWNLLFPGKWFVIIWRARYRVVLREELFGEKGAIPSIWEGVAWGRSTNEYQEASSVESEDSCHTESRHVFLVLVWLRDCRSVMLSYVIFGWVDAVASHFY